MTKTFIGAVLGCLLVGVVGCSKADDASLTAPSESKDIASSSAKAASVESKGVRTQAGSKAGGQTVSIEAKWPDNSVRQVVRKAKLAVRVPNVEKGEKQADAIIRAGGGYVDTASSNDLAGEHPSMDITARIPVATFDDSIDRFEALGIPVSKTISSEDVTGSVVDLDARLNTLRAEEASYLQMLRKTDNMSTSMDIKDKLQEVRGNIESIAGQRKTLGGLAAMSTVELNLSQAASGAVAPQDKNWLAQSWGEATGSFASVSRVVATIGIWAALFSPFWVPVGLFGRWVYRQRTLGRPSVQRTI